MCMLLRIGEESWIQRPAMCILLGYGDDGRAHAHLLLLLLTIIRERATPKLLLWHSFPVLSPSEPLHCCHQAPLHGSCGCCCTGGDGSTAHSAGRTRRRRRRSRRRSNRNTGRSRGRDEVEEEDDPLFEKAQPSVLQRAREETPVSPTEEPFPPAREQAWWW